VTIIDMFSTRNVVEWLKEDGRPEIPEPHFPLRWLGASQRDELKEELAAGHVRIVDLPHRSDPERILSFLVLVNASPSDDNG
jgi:hypothetical protein